MPPPTLATSICLSTAADERRQTAEPGHCPRMFAGVWLEQHRLLEKGDEIEWIRALLRTDVRQGRTISDQVRSGGSFAPQPVSETAGSLERLIAFTGRTAGV